MREFSKADIAKAKKVSTRTVDNWVASGKLPRPRKWGETQQARVRWTEEDLAALDRNLTSRTPVGGLSDQGQGGAQAA